MPATRKPIRSRQGCRRRQHRQRGVDDEADHHDVGDRAEAGPLPQRDPQQQEREPGRITTMPSSPVAFDRPWWKTSQRVEPEPALDHQGHADAVQHQAGEELTVRRARRRGRMARVMLLARSHLPL